MPLNFGEWHFPLTLVPLLLSPVLLLVLLSQHGGEASIHGWRIRRQVNVTSGGSVMGNGNRTDMSASNYLWKMENGVVGANGTSMGTAGGPGNSNLMSNSNAVVGSQKVEGVGVAMANGSMTRSDGSSSSNINGNQMGVQNSASGAALGTGNTQVVASGAGSLMNGNQSSLYSGKNTFGQAGATGSISSFSQASMGQSLNFFSIMTSLSAIASAKGENNAQANIDLRGGSPSNGISIDGLVSGVNDKGGGSVFSQAVGKGTLNNQSAAMSSGLMGAVNATSGGSKLVGASSLSSNGTSNPSSVNAFGDLNLNGTGKSQGGLISNSSVNADGTVRGLVGLQGMGDGANKSIDVNGGIKTSDGSGAPQTAIGRGTVQGTGNMAANGSSFVLTNYQTGQGDNLLVGSQGQSLAKNGTPSELLIQNQGYFLNGSQMTNASSNAKGKVTGDQSSVVGGAIMDLSSQAQSGNSSIVATGQGKGSSSALTDANLNLAGPGGAPQQAAVKGSVNANGDQTYVQSVSNVSARNGLQSIFNSQNATVQGQGSSQAQASNYAILKRRRRRRAAHHVGKLAGILEGLMEKGD